MKTRTVVFLVLAIVLIFAGGILLILGLSFAGGPSQVAATTEKTYVVNEPFNGIQVDTTVCDVTLVRTGGAFQAVCPDSEKLSYTVTVEDGILCVRQVDLRTWYDFIGINLAKQEMTLYLPDTHYDTLQIHTDTGKVLVQKDFSFQTAGIFTSTGDVDFSAAVSEQLTVQVSTGRISIQGSNPAMLQVSASTGDVMLQDMVCGECYVNTTTGKIAVENLHCQLLDCHSSTGDKQLHNVLAEQYIKAISTTGYVELVDCDAPLLTIETDTGDVDGILLTPKVFFADSNTGNIRIPNPSGAANGECYVNSSTGDITFACQQ